MLFFRKHDSDIDIPFEMKNWINRQSKRRNKVFCEFPKKIIVTLQVRLPENMTARSGKRVSFSASASMTVEAALVLPLFLFAGCILMQPFPILNTQRQVQEILEVTAEDISQNAGVAWSSDIGANDGSGRLGLCGSFCAEKDRNFAHTEFIADAVAVIEGWKNH